MFISVIIPTYKPKSYLWECLSSLVKQKISKNNFEVILVLNGCTNPWKGEIENFISAKMQGMNVNFIHTEQPGASNARNLGLEVARGEYITFLDDDDFVSPLYLEEFYQMATSNTIVLSYPYAFDDGILDVQVPYPITDVYDSCYTQMNNKISSKVRKYFSGPCMKLIPMSIIQDRRFDVRFKNGEDTLFMFLISDRIKYIRFTSKNAVYYRRNREGSAVNVKRKFSDVCYSNLLQIVTYVKYYIKNPMGYNIPFFFSRIGGALYAVVSRLVRL